MRISSRNFTEQPSPYESPQSVQFYFIDRCKGNEHINAGIHAQRTAVQRDMIVMHIAPLAHSKGTIVELAPLVLIAQALFRFLAVIAIEAHHPLGAELHIRIDEDVEAILTATQYIIAATADNYARTLVGKIGNDLGLRLLHFADEESVPPAPAPALKANA